MKYLFLAIFVFLVIASLVTARLLPEANTDKPIIYWVTDSNPAREEQIRLFHEWMKKNGYPEVELHLDTANNAQAKKIIQSVSGVGGDVMDMGSGAGMRLFHAMGLLRDVTDEANRLGFDMSKTYPALEPELTLKDGTGALRQFMFPCNVSTSMYYINKGTFRQHGQPLPPTRWTIEEFERLGKQFVTAANPPGTRASQRVFYADRIDLGVLRRSLGLSEFNETLTRSTLDDPINVRALELYYKWMFADKLIPSAADQSSFATESGYGGQSPQLFNSGNYAMLLTGRYLLIQFRKFDESRKARGEPLLELGLAEHPHGGFPNSLIGTRAGAVYAGSKHPDLAAYFLAYLASEDYNLQIVRDGDALPPNPRYTTIPEYLEPKDFPGEWGLHKQFADDAQTISIGGSYSPFVLHQVSSRIESEHRDDFLNGRCTAKEAAERMARDINAEIQRSLQEDPKLLPLYQQRVERQAKIDQLRAAGQKVPADWIEDPFHKKYYAEKGWLEASGAVVEQSGVEQQQGASE